VGVCSYAGKEVAVVKEEGKIVFWCPWSGKRIGVIKKIGQDVISMCIAKNGNSLALGLKDGRIIVCELPSGKITMESRANEWGIRSIAISPTGNLLIAGDDDGVTCWDVNTKKRLWSASESFFARPAIAICPDGTAVVCGGEKGRFAMRDIRTGRVLSTFTHGTNDWNAFAFNPNGTEIAAGNRKGEIAIWSLQ